MAAKLPLTARKNIRDEYNEKIGDLKSQIKEYTGEDYEFVVVFEELYPKVKADDQYQTTSPGSIAFNAYSSLVDQLKTMTDEGEDQLVKEHFNKVVHTRKVNILIEDMESGYTLCRVKDGVLELVYKTDNFGTNTSYIASELAKALDESYLETNRSELPLTARKGFRDDYEQKKKALMGRISEELLGAFVDLVADPEAIWRLAIEEQAKLKKRDQSEIDLESINRNMGSAIYAYFDGFASTLNYVFKQDGMMVEAFMEACPKKEIHFKLVAKPDLSRSYNDGVFEDGAYVIRASPQTWYTNSSYACEDIEKLL
ncbi:hypothetical protein DRE_07283 [Drechslerella stenobrocha 248]|uniref:Uncharacterized protein n=1 Tax=Drechslerella stenobrocha 248 TaxID=1043628 RepID=W7HLA0_9PEZI|nr:hypothetical protein DRE_07283 [Drechslerella stenobrocha 248]